MQFDFQAMKPMDRYELLLSTVLPRPITIVTTLSVDGALNATPYSLFNVVSHDPPAVMIAVLPHPERRLKDTAANIFATREFVVNLVPRSMAEAMNITNIDAPPGTNELKLADLEVAPSASVKPPRVANSPVAFECRLLNALSFNSDQAIMFGEVITAIVSDDLVLDVARAIVDAPKLDLFGAMHAARWYCSIARSVRNDTAQLGAMDRRRQSVTLMVCPNRTHAPQQKAPYSMTSSARASSWGGISSPSVFAVLRLITSSNLAACITGMSIGLSPLRTRPV
jgi:flavin reductase (DIM6/NTAB) family NADH-FMN oxidoreductase RutF